MASNKLAATDEKVQQALTLYLSRVPIAEIAALCNVAQSSIYNWMRAGRMSNGIKWKEYRKAKEKEAVTRAKNRNLANAADDTAEFFAQAKGDVRDVYNKLIDKLKDGQFKPTVADISTLLTLTATLDNHGAEKIEWMEKMMAKILGIVIDIMDKEQFARFELKMIEMRDTEVAKLDPIVKHQFVGNRNSNASSTHRAITGK